MVVLLVGPAPVTTVLREQLSHNTEPCDRGHSTAADSVDPGGPVVAPAAERSHGLDGCAVQAVQASIRRHSPVSPLGGPRGTRRTSPRRRRLPSRLRRRADGGKARRPRPTRNRLSAPRSPAAAAPPIPPVPSSFTPAKGHGQSSRNGDVSDPTTAKQRGDLRGRGGGPAGRATPSATSSATDRRNPWRNLVLLAERGDQSCGASSSATARTGSSGPRTVRQHCCVLRHPPPQGRARCERVEDGGACGCTAAPSPPHLPRSR